MRRTRHWSLLLAVTAVPAAVLAQGKPERAGFVVRLGSDTLAVEQYTRSATRLESDLAVRVPRTRLMHYVATLNPDGTIARVTISVRPMTPGPGAPPAFTGDLAFGKDSAKTTIKTGDSTQVTSVAINPGAMPLTSFSYALYEQLVLRARKVGKDSLPLQVIPFGANQAFETYVVRHGDSAAIGYFGSPARARTDKNGRLLSLDGKETTNKVIVERVASADVNRFARESASRDAGGQAVGQLSARDTVSTTVGKAHVTIDYGRPHKRGREIFGTIVPWNQVWRTGANAATGFTTDADLKIGDTTVPKGSYTLWTLPSPSGTKLIINSQTGQWGTEYDAAKDFARIDVVTDALAAPVEVFTIGVEPKGDAGVLTLQWDQTRWSLPVTVQ